MKKIMELLPNFPSGPLDRYRKIGSFDWRKMKLVLESEQIIAYKNEIVEALKKNPICHPPRQGLNFNETRHLATLKMQSLYQIPETDFMNTLDDLQKPVALMEVMCQWDSGVWIKVSLSRGMFTSVLTSLGTEKHFDLAGKIQKGQGVGCFCLTEIGHGTNTKAMQTRATYVPETREFIMHSPNFEAAKCWAGLLGQLATHAIVYAQLYTADGVNHGLHQFIVQIRDVDTLKAAPGIVVGDMGEKIGLNGTDNGFLMFNNFRMPYDALLNKNADITKEGKYVTPFADANKRFGASLATLSQGRVNITNICSAYLSKGISIAVRYAAVRTQFGPEGEEEIPVIEYQTQQHRLLPYLAGAYALKIFSIFLVRKQYEAIIKKVMGVQEDNDPEFGLEMHGISAASKPIAGWFTRDALQECREACAGHGYLKASAIGDVRNDNDANCTYEGENHVLIQQTSNWLLKFWPDIVQGKKIEYPMESVNFLSRAKETLNLTFIAKSTEHISQPEYILHMYEWLVCYLLKITYEKYERNISSGKDAFTSRNENQVYYARNLAIAYIQHFVLYRFFVHLNEVSDPAVRNALVRMFGLYGLFNLEKHTIHLYQGGFFQGSQPAVLMQDAILNLCQSLKDDAVALVDAIAPDDFLINSVLGNSDGQVYERLKASFFDMEDGLTRPKWWKDVVTWMNRTSKL